jgi:hypothetical protein
MRAIVSVFPPAAYGTTAVMGRVGQVAGLRRASEENQRAEGATDAARRAQYRSGWSDQQAMAARVHGWSLLRCRRRVQAADRPITTMHVPGHRRECGHERRCALAKERRANQCANQKAAAANATAAF